MSAAAKFEGRAAEGVIAKLVKTFVKDAERLEAKAAAKYGARDAERAAAKQAGKQGEKLTEAFKRNYVKRFTHAFPNTEGKVVVHHSLEKNIEKRFPGRFTEEEIHELASLRGIPRELNSDLHLSNIRRMWDRFAEEFPNANRNQIRAFRDFVDDQWGSFYTPPVR